MKQHQAQLRLGTSGTLAIMTQRRTQAGQGTETKISWQENLCLLAPRWDLIYS